MIPKTDSMLTTSIVPCPESKQDVSNLALNDDAYTTNDNIPYNDTENLPSYSGEDYQEDIVQNKHHPEQNRKNETKNYHAITHEMETHDDYEYKFSYIDHNYDDMDEVMKIIDVFCNFYIIFCTQLFSSQRCFLLAT